MPQKSAFKLGLIGDNITSSQAPLLHQTAGQLAGLDVTYDLLIPARLGLTFDEVFAHARTTGYRGVNITYPYKELAHTKAAICDPLLRAMGAINTVIFEKDGPRGFNTDYSGFVRAYRAARADAAPGTVCLIGTGGVGKAVAFGLLELRAHTIRCVDLDASKAEALARALAALGSATKLEVFSDPVLAAKGADGVINCTPLGMVGIGGAPLPADALPGASWAFDAVYTPVETPFLKHAARAGLDVISGYELFIGQGVEAWKIFVGAPLDEGALRRAIAGVAQGR